MKNIEILKESNVKTTKDCTQRHHIKMLNKKKIKKKNKLFVVMQ